LVGTEVARRSESKTPVYVRGHVCVWACSWACVWACAYM